MIEPVSVMSEAPARAIPKSVTLTWSLSSTITLWGLRSRWMTPRRCAKRAAFSIWIVRSIARFVSSGASSRIRRLSVRPSQILHRDVVGALEAAAIEDADDVRMLERRGRLRLPAEALDEARILGEAAVQQLERNLAVELLVLGQVDVRHAAGTQAMKHPVAPVDDGPRIEFAH